MNLTHLRYFYEVCRWKNISKAAAYLHVSQPTISVAMQDLEDKTGLNLFHRGKKKIEITDDGMILYRKILPILNSLNDLESTIQNLSHTKNHIKLAIPLQIGAYLLPAVIGTFKKLHPEISLEISEAGGIDALRMLENEELDLAITNYNKAYGNNFIYHKIYDVECCFITYPEHPVAAKSVVSLSDIAAEPLVLLSGGFFVNDIIDKAFLAANITPHVLLYSPQLHTVKNLVRQKVASAILTRQALLDHDGLIPISFQKPLRINSGIVMKKGHQIYDDERALIQFIKQNFRKR